MLTVPGVVDVALAVADRLRDNDMPNDPEAAAGCAILYGQLDRLRPDESWAVVAHRSLAAAVRAVERMGTGFPALFGGMSGVAFAANLLCRDGQRYQNLLAELDRSITRSAAGRGELLAKAPAGLPFNAFDLISGITGQGAYLLSRGLPMTDVLTGLVALCGHDGDVPNWHTVYPALAKGTPMEQQFPAGVLNCGLAHGVTGPLALLAIADRAGVHVEGQRAAIEQVAEWLASNRTDDPWGPSWPNGFALTGDDDAAPTHNAWCYGSAGVARALWLAGEALDSSALRDLAVESMLAIYERPPAARVVDRSPGLCHGIAGVLQISLRFALDTRDSRFTAGASAIARQLVDGYEPFRKYGYGSIANDGSLADEPGLIDGAAGVALALLSAGTDLPMDWDRILLLA